MRTDGSMVSGSHLEPINPPSDQRSSSSTPFYHSRPGVAHVSLSGPDGEWPLVRTTDDRGRLGLYLAAFPELAAPLVVSVKSK